MVLETRLRYLAGFAASLAIAGAAHAQPSATTSEEATVGATVLTLSQSGSGCAIGAADAESIDLGLSGPCYFGRVDDRLLAYPYPRFGADMLVAVIGDPISDETRSAYGLDKARACGSSLRGVVVNGAKIALAPEAASGGLFCRNTLIDEKNFYGLAESFSKAAK